MKKLVLFFLCLILYSFVNLYANIIVNSSTEVSLNVSVSLPDVQFSEREYTDGNTYSTLIVPSAGQLAIGKPDVPGFAKWILISNGTNVSISTFPGEPEIYEDINLPPVQPEPSDFKDALLPPFTKDETVFSTNTDYPGVFAETESVKHKRGQSCTILWIYPYQYNPVQKRLTVYPDLEVRVNFNGIIKPIPSNLKNDELIKYLKATAINAEEVLAAEEKAENYQTDNRERTDGCELLIITHPDFEDAANTLSDWKIRKGIFTQVVTTTTTGSSGSNIENYINNAYDTWTPAPSYLLFIGDTEYVPVLYDGTTGTDFFYADRNSPADWVADFGYGRLSVDTAAEADSLIARIIRYERSPTSNSSYYTSILNAACFQDGELLDPPPHELPDGIANRRFCKTSEDVRNYLATQGFSSQREYVAYNRVNSDEIFPHYWNDITQAGNYIFENDNPPNGGIEIPASLQKPTFPWDGNTAGITSAFNNGKYFALFRAHGGRSGWGDPNFNRGNVDALTNGEDRPFVWSITCQTGWFDNETDDASYGTGFTSECFAEHWIRHSTGGSCGVIASIRNSYSGYNDRLIWGMMDAIWPGFTTWCLDPYGGSNPIFKMGDVVNYGKDYMSTKYSGSGREQTIKIFHWFGDPTTEMWTSEPNELASAEVTSNIYIGSTTITVQVSPAVQGMLVSICSENADNLFGTAITNSSGIATVTLNHAITMEAKLFITITKHDYLPYEFTAGLNTWTGIVSTDWNNAANWSGFFIPDATITVTIPSGTPYQPTIGTGTSTESAYCDNLTIQSGAVLTQTGTATYRSFFYVNGNFNSDAGTFTQNSDFAFLYFKGSDLISSWDDDNEDDTYTMVRVNKTGTNTLDMWQDMTVKNFEIRGGNFKIDGTWTLTVTSNLSYAFQVEDGGILTLQDETIDVPFGDVEFADGSQANVSGGLIRCGDEFRVLANAAYDIQFTGGTVEMYGSLSQYIEDLDGNTELFDLVINKSSGTCAIDYGDLDVGNDFTISSGTLNSNNYDIYVGGDWTNNVGDAGFVEGIGRVVFNSSNHQYCYGENFNILELNRSSMDFIIPNGTTTTCQILDWTDYNGELEVDGGTFIAYELEQTGIFGKYYLTSNGGLLELHQSLGEYVDLNGRIVIADGTMNIYGGTLYSYWPYAANAAIWMYGGVLDFKDSGIKINNSATYSLDDNITGGTIRTSRDFIGFRTDYNPIGGTTELYGSLDADLSMGTGSNFYDVWINKATSDEIIRDSKDNKRILHNRDGTVNELTRSNMVNATSELDINGDFIIDIGVFDTNGFDMYIAGDWTNNVGDAGFVEGTQTVTFDGAGFSEIVTNETFYNLSQNNTSINYNALQLNYGLTATVANDIDIIDGKFELNTNSTLIVGNDVYIAFESGLNAWGDTGLEIYVGGNWTNDNTEWDTGLGYSPDTEVITFNGSTDQFITTQAPQEDFGNLVIDKTGGEFRSNDNIRVIHDLDILAGGWHDNTGLLTHYFEGDFYIAAGTAAFWNSLSDNTVVFKGLSDQTVFNPIGYHYFRNIVIDKTAWATRNFINNEGTESILSKQENTNLTGDVTGTRTMTVSLTSDIDMQLGDGLTINEGVLDLNGMILNSMGDVIIYYGGKLIVDEGAILKVHNGNSLTVYNGGILEVLGAPGNLATITHRVTGNYDFNIYPGGTISAEYVLFEYMTANGVYVWDGGIIDRSYSFNYSTFQNGFVGYGTLLYINNADDVTITGANFPDDSSSDYNVAKTYDQGTISMINAIGSFAGYDYELDLYNLIDWGALPAINDLTIHYNIVDNKIVLIWTYPFPVDQYKIYRSTDPYDFSGADVFISFTESYSETATGTKYFYRVTAENISGNGVSGKTVEFGKGNSNK
jgi:hypothetical protein